MKRVLITGGSKGLGRALCRLFLEKGYEVISVSRSHNSMDGIIAYYADLSRSQERRHFIEQIVSRFSRIDVLINNAGLALSGLLADFNEMDYEQVIETNFSATRHLTEAFLPLLTNGGSVVAITSRVGREGRAGLSGYAVSKGLLMGYVTGIAESLHQKGVRIIGVNPGFMQTDMVRPRHIEKQRKQSLLGAINAVETSARFVYWLSEATWGTGRIFDCDGREYKSWTN
ncbi:MAG: hypothetical protein A2293_11655 [Elusimicrobia bacterium RIFOXYB2_FULL_49_7]|nr:MAG: hypothetical protein A2293_11655 [Elusimicrobia bacterium RIFOXYB2_FULL_49_7]